MSQGRLHRTPEKEQASTSQPHALNSSVTSHIAPTQQSPTRDSTEDQTTQGQLTQAGPQQIIWQKPKISVLLGTFPHQDHRPGPSPLQANDGVCIYCLFKTD